MIPTRQTSFDKQIKELDRELIVMGALCENALTKMTAALLSRNPELAGELPNLINQINQKEQEIESICLRLLLRQHPLAGDFRTVSSTLKMVTDAKRIGRQAADIADLVARGQIHDASVFEQLPLKEMADATISMVTKSFDAVAHKDEKLAASVIEADDVVDGYFVEIKQRLVESLKNTEVIDETAGETVINLMMIAKYFERIGDHAANIAHWLRFSVSGTLTPEQTKPTTV